MPECQNENVCVVCGGGGAADRRVGPRKRTESRTRARSLCRSLSRLRVRDRVFSSLVSVHLVLPQTSGEARGARGERAPEAKSIIGRIFYVSILILIFLNRERGCSTA